MTDNQLCLDLNDGKQQAEEYYRIITSDSYNRGHVYIFDCNGSQKEFYLGTRHRGPVEAEYTYLYKIDFEAALHLLTKYKDITTNIEELKTIKKAV